MHFFLFAFYAFVAIGLIYFWKFFDLLGIKPKALVGVFLLKLVFGFGLASLYTHYYDDRRGGDAYRFFDDGILLHASFRESPEAFLHLMTGVGIEKDSIALKYYHRMTHMQLAFYTGYPNDNATIIRANALTTFLSQGYYHVHTVVWCFLSMIGLTAILKILLRHFPRKKWAMFGAVYLLPTTLFWSSGVLKEPLLLLGIGLFLLGFFRWIYSEFSARDIIPTILGLGLLLLTKGYVVQCMAPGIAFLILTKINGGKRLFVSFLAPHILTIALIFAGPLLSNGLKVAEIMADRREAFYDVAKSSGAGSVIQIPDINQSSDVILNAPEAIVITYFKPWPWEWNNLLYIPAALENLFLVFCLLTLVFYFRRPPAYSLPIVLFGLSFVLVFGALAGQVVPVLGALVRYKLPALIFLFAITFACSDFISIQRRFPVIRKWVKKHA